MRSRPGIFIAIIAVITVTVSGLGYVFVKQSERAQPAVAKQAARYEAQQSQAKKQAPAAAQSATTESQVPQLPTQNTSNDETPTTTIQVFFSKDPDSFTSANKVFPVDRKVTDNQDPNILAVAGLIAGPTEDEQNQGFIGGITLSGDSNCDGKDFNLSVNGGTVKMQLCRHYVSDGSTSDTQLLAQMNRTLGQIPTVSKIILLDNNGNCLFDKAKSKLCLE
jgi:hypothetical protein